jgi:RNA polymerase sigma-70 factor (ECF subfamily)
MTPKQTKSNNLALTLAHFNYNKGLNSYALFKLHDVDVGENLVQDTFMKTWAYLVKGGKILMMKAFLFHVLNNLIVDEYRRRKHRTESLDTLVDKGLEPKEEDTLSLVNFLDGKAAVRRIIELPLKYKKVMHMRFVQSMSLEEISKSTGQTKNAVAVQIHRGLIKLKELCATKLAIIT